MNNKPNMQYLSPGVYRGPNGSLVGRNGQQLPGQAARPNMPQGGQRAPQGPQGQQMPPQGWTGPNAFGNQQRDYNALQGQLQQNWGDRGFAQQPMGPQGGPNPWRQGTPPSSQFMQQAQQQYNPGDASQYAMERQQNAQGMQRVPMSPEEQMQQVKKFNPGKQGASGLMGAPPTLTKSGQVGGY